MHGDVGARGELVDGALDFIRHRMRLGERLGAIDEDVQIHKEDGTGITNAPGGNHALRGRL